MRINLQTTIQEIDSVLTNASESLAETSFNVLKKLGESCENEARTNGNYIDQTGDLRSSIGFAIAENGKAVYVSKFNQVKQGGSGVKEGKDLALELSKEAKELTLIVVAGKKYALYVEATNRIVLASARLMAEHEFLRITKEIS